MRRLQSLIATPLVAVCFAVLLVAPCFAAMLVAICFTAMLASPAYSVPLAEWEADEAKLLGEQTVTRADLPDAWQGLSDEELAELMEEIYAKAEEYYDDGEYVQALPEYQQYDYIARYLSNDKLSNKALNEIGCIYYCIGQFLKALVYFDKSLVISRKVNDKKAEAEALNNVGLAYSALRQYDEALKYCELSLSIDRNIEDVQGEGTSLNNIGLVYHNLGQYEKALSYYKQSLAIDCMNGSTRSKGISLNNIGLVYCDLGQYEKALRYQQQSLAIRRENDDIRGEGSNLNNLGLIYHDLQELDETLAYYNQALTLFREIEDTWNEGVCIMNIGSVYKDLSQYENALTYFKQSLEIFRELDDNWGVGLSLGSIGSVYTFLDRFEEAIAFNKESLVLFRKIRDTQSEAEVLNNLGLAYKGLGQYEEGLTYFKQSISIFKEIGDIRGEIIGLRNTGSVYMSLGISQEALACHQKAFKLACLQATQFTWESGLKGGLVEALADTANALAEVHLELGRQAEAFATVQSAKGVPLLQLLAQGEHISDDPDVQARLDEYRNANAALQVYHQQLTELSDEDEVSEEELEKARSQHEYFTEMIDEYQAQANDAWDWLKENAPEITDIIEVKGFTVDEVQAKVLQPGQVVLEYLVTDEEVIIFCLPWEGELVVEQAALPELKEGQNFTDWLERRLFRLYGQDKEWSRQAAQQLYDLLIAPVEEAIPPGAELIICPDRSLFLVPYEALMDAQGAHLLEKHPMSYSTSATMLSYIKPAPAAEGALVAAVSLKRGDAALDKLLPESGLQGSPLPAAQPNASEFSTKATEANDEESDAVEKRSARDPLRKVIFEHGEFPPLAAVVDEATDVSALFDATLMIDTQATEPAIREAMPGKRVVHFASHGYISEVPLLNGIVLHLVEPAEAGGEEAEDGQAWTAVNTADNGFLTMGEVMGIPLKGCELVTLSCCETAKGETNPGAGVMGLTQGFMYAGAQSVLASLRSVDDEATRELMVKFYENWQDGMTKREALRQAKLWYLQERHPSPQYWAPFVLYGVE